MVLAAPALEVAVHAGLYRGGELPFTVPVSDVEVATVLKALSWRSRLADKDISDLCSLMAIVHQHRRQLPGGWKLDEATQGPRLDAQRALRDLVNIIDRINR